jgi:hypothetical protein
MVWLLPGWSPCLSDRRPIEAARLSPFCRRCAPARARSSTPRLVWGRRVVHAEPKGRTSHRPSSHSFALLTARFGVVLAPSRPPARDRPPCLALAFVIGITGSGGVAARLAFVHGRDSRPDLILITAIYSRPGL